MPRPQRYARHHPAPAHRAMRPATPSLRIADQGAPSPVTDMAHARALQQRLIHRFERGELELPAVRRYPPSVRLTLLLGATASLWWSLYVLSRVALG